MNDRPVSIVLDALERANGRRAARNADHWTTVCPAHEDRRPSLSVHEAESGAALLHCFSGCPVEAIVRAIGLTMRDLMPPKPALRSTLRAGGNGAARRPAFKTADEAIAELSRSRGKPAATWTYHNTSGEPVGVVVRWNTPDGKDFRPASRSGGGWIIGAMPEPRPLYRLPELLTRVGERVHVCEGEKAADAARSIRLLATTSPHGSNSASKADWSPLTGHEVVVLPDNDRAGRKYADQVAHILTALSPPATVRVVELPGLPDGGDFVEYLAARRTAGLDDVAIRVEVTALADAAELIEPERRVPSVEAFQRFPLEALPETLAQFVAESAAALGCDPVFVALPCLATIAASVGTARMIQLKSSWSEPLVLWVVVVARSGSLKSPALDMATAPLWRVQAEAMQVYEAEREAYEQAKAGGDLPKGSKPPVPQRYIVGDTTLEALIVLLEDNPRGLLVARDELSGWVRSFDAYKPRGRGGDVATWLELHRAGPVFVDRKSGEHQTIFVPRAAVSVCGTVQPGTLAAVLAGEHLENGFAARLLMAAPPQMRKRWSDRVPPRKVLVDYGDAIRRLLELKPAGGEHGPEPVRLPLTPEAQAAWANWYDLHAGRIERAGTDYEAAALAKIEAVAARLALLCELVAWPDATAVSADSVRRGTVLADWFAGESGRAYGLLAESDEDRGRRQLAELIQRRGGAVTTRDLMRCCRRFQTAAAAEAGLSELATAGFGSWEQDPPGPRGGKPTRRFRVIGPGVDDTLRQTSADSVDADNTPAGDPANGGIVNVNTVSASESGGCVNDPDEVLEWVG